MSVPAVLGQLVCPVRQLTEKLRTDGFEDLELVPQVLDALVLPPIATGELDLNAALQEEWSQSLRKE